MAEASTTGWRDRVARLRWSRLSKNTRRRIVFYGALLALILAAFGYTTAMPGSRYRGPLPPLSARAQTDAIELREIVTQLAVRIGERTTRKPAALAEAREYLSKRWENAGLDPQAHPFRADGVVCANIDVTLAGTTRADEVVVIGGHYDSAPGATGADDNATGAAATLLLATRLAYAPHARTLRFALFVNEEPPHFWSPTMGSLVYANALRARGTNVVAMLSLESIGFFRTEPGSQRYPVPLAWLYGDVGDYVMFVGNLTSRGLTRDVVRTFRRAAKFPSDGAAMPGFIPGVGWSDHWSFWQNGYDAVMVTDSAPFRNANYHTLHDLPETLDFERFARVVGGIEAVIEHLANP